MMKKLVAQLQYWLMALPVATLLLLELTLQAGGYINRHFMTNNQQDGWLTSSLRVVTMGDSNTYGLYLQPHESYPKQLEALWNASHTNSIEVINLGYPGANSSRIVANLESVIDHFHPDIILVMIGTNDSWTAPIAAAGSSLTGDSDNPLQWLKMHSRVYRLYCLVTRQSFSDAQLETVTTSDPKQAETAKDKPATINYQDMQLDFSMAFRKQDDGLDPNTNMAGNLEKLINFARNSNNRIIFLTYPANKGYYKQANKITRETVARQQYGDFIDVTDAFTDYQPAKDAGNDYFFRDLHATAAGNRLVAQRVMAGMEKLLATSPQGER